MHLAWNNFADGTPKKRGEYLCYQPANEDGIAYVDARFVVLKWTGKKFVSSFPVSHWMPLPPKP